MKTFLLILFKRMPQSHKTTPLCLCGFVAIFLWNILIIYPCQAQDKDMGYAKIRLENEFKLSVPNNNQAERIWDYLQSNYSNDSIKTFLGNSFSTIFSIEHFIDIYFDDESHTLLNRWCGIRYRQRFISPDNLGSSKINLTKKDYSIGVNRILVKQLIQLKIGEKNSQNPIRKEIKFRYNATKSKKDKFSEHPFLKYIHRADRDAIERYLVSLGTTSQSLTPSISIQQNRKRVYISESGQPFITITLDIVSKKVWPKLSFTEIEIELNEIRFTYGDENQREWMEKINSKIKENLIKKFPDLVQDQKPKYNKIYELKENNFISKLTDQLIWIVFSSLILTAVILFIRNHRRK